MMILITVYMCKNTIVYSKNLVQSVPSKSFFCPLLVICWKFCIALPNSLKTFLLVIERRLGVQDGILLLQRHCHLLVAQVQGCGVGSQEWELNLPGKQELD